MHSLRQFICESLLLEDKRGSIVKRLGIPKEFADFLHNFHPPQSHKYSYWMAEQFLDAHDQEAKRWLKEARRNKKKKWSYAGTDLWPTEQGKIYLEQGDEVYNAPRGGDKGKYVGHSPAGVVWVVWTGKENYESMVSRLDEAWEAWIVEGLKRRFRINAWDETFSEIFEWHEKSGGGSDLSKLTWDKAIERATTGQAFRTSEEGGRIIMRFDDGFYWIDLAKEFCQYEHDEMGHCAEDDRGTLWSLRDKYGKPHVTATVTADGKIVQMKGKENKKPIEKYHKYIAQLLATDHITGISTGEDSGDFNLSDLGEKPRQWLMSERPEWKYVIDPRQAILDYANGELPWKRFQAIADEYLLSGTGAKQDIYHENDVEWMMDVEDLGALFMTEEEEETAYKNRYKRNKSDATRKVELISAFLSSVFSQKFSDMKKILVGGRELSQRNEERLKPLVLALNDFYIKLVEKALKLEGLHFEGKRRRVYLSGRMSYKDLAKMMGLLYQLRYADKYTGVGSVIYDYIIAKDIKYDLQPEHIYRVMEKFGYWYIKDFEMEWHSGHAVAVTAQVEHTITGREKEADDYVGVNPDVEFTQVTHEEHFGADRPEYDTPMRGRKAQQSVLLTATDEDNHTWQLQIELDPKTGEWDEDSFYDWECYDCEDEEYE